MQDLGEAKRIIGIDIVRNRQLGILVLSQESYCNKILSRFYMKDCKIVSVPIGQHLKFSANQSPKTDIERAEMADVPYANVVGSFMYLMVWTRPDLTYDMSLICRYMSNPGKQN